MPEMQLMIGGSDTSWIQVAVSTVMPSIVAAVSVLGGVWMTNLGNRKLRQAELDARSAERAEDRRYAEAKARNEGGFAALDVAETLEGFARKCSEIMREDPYSYEADSLEEFTMGFYRKGPDLGPWPGVDWHALGHIWAARARGLAEQVHFENRRLDDISAELTPSDTNFQHKLKHSLARMGNEAYGLAKEMREAFDLPMIEPGAFLPTIEERLQLIEREELNRSLRENADRVARGERRRAARREKALNQPKGR